MQARHVQDPVCGMWIDPAAAAATADHDHQSYFFCNAACRRAFLGDPDRYAGPELDAVNGSPGILLGAAHQSRPCPACGGRVELPESIQERIGDVTLDEFATLVRARWRRRLGRRAYRREHSPRFIRSIAAYALDPQSPIRSMVLEEELTLEVARLRADGLNRAQMRRELYHLACVTVEVVADCGLEPAPAAPMIEAIHSRLGAVFQPARDAPGGLRMKGGSREPSAGASERLAGRATARLAVPGAPSR